jgi:hypothetical protein
VKTIFKPITRDTRINSESNCTPILQEGTITKKMQNEPNLTKTQTRKNAKQTQFQPASDEIRATRHANDANFTLYFSSEIHKKALTFPQNMKKIRTFCKFLKITYLTPCTTKAYMNFHPHLSVTLQEMRDTKNAKRTQFRIYRLFTHHAQRVTGHESRFMPNGPRASSQDSCKTNPISTSDRQDSRDKTRKSSRFYSKKVSKTHQIFKNLSHFLSESEHFCSKVLQKTRTFPFFSSKVHQKASIFHNFSFKTNPISPGNLFRALRRSLIYTGIYQSLYRFIASAPELIYSSTHLLIYLFMQNEPNSKLPHVIPAKAGINDNIRDTRICKTNPI